VVIQSYRHRFGLVPGDPALAGIEPRLARSRRSPCPRSPSTAPTTACARRRRRAAWAPLHRPAHAHRGAGRRPQHAAGSAGACSPTRCCNWCAADIICPHCGKAFKIDEAGYADILKQVRDGAFEQQLHERLELAERDKRNAVALATAQAHQRTAEGRRGEGREIQGLKASSMRRGGAQAGRGQALAVEKERDALANELEQARRASPRGGWPRRCW
jgi:hypothetical protein